MQYQRGLQLPDGMVKDLEQIDAIANDALHLLKVRRPDVGGSNRNSSARVWSVEVEVYRTINLRVVCAGRMQRSVDVPGTRPATLDYTLIHLYGSSSMHCIYDIRTDCMDLPTELQQFVP